MLGALRAGWRRSFAGLVLEVAVARVGSSAGLGPNFTLLALIFGYSMVTCIVAQGYIGPRKKKSITLHKGNELQVPL